MNEANKLIGQAQSKALTSDIAKYRNCVSFFMLITYFDLSRRPVKRNLHISSKENAFVLSYPVLGLMQGLSFSVDHIHYIFQSFQQDLEDSIC